MYGACTIVLAGAQLHVVSTFLDGGCPSPVRVCDLQDWLRRPPMSDVHRCDMLPSHLGSSVISMLAATVVPWDPCAGKA